MGGGALLVWAASQPERPTDLESLALANLRMDANIPVTPTQDWSGLPIDSNEALHSELVEIRSQTPEQLTAKQWNRFMADLDKLVAGDTPDPETAATLYPPDWTVYVEDYRQHKENREILFTAAVVLSGVGAVTVVLCIMIGSIHGIMRLLHRKPPSLETEVEDDTPIRTGAIREVPLDGRNPHRNRYHNPAHKARYQTRSGTGAIQGQCRLTQ